MIKQIQKKGQAIQFLPYLLIGVVFVVGIAIFAITTTHIGDELFDEMKDNSLINASNNSVARISQVQTFMTGAADQLVFFLLGAILLGFVALAMFSDFHPVILAVFILFIILMAVLAGTMSNVVDDVGDTDVLSNKSAEFNMTNQVLGQAFPILIVVFGAVGVIILLAKRGKVSAPV